MKKPTKYVTEYIVQGLYGHHGWEDLTAENTLSEAHAQRRVYDANEPAPHRVITRRVPNPQHVESK